MNDFNVILYVHGFRGSKHSFARLPDDLEHCLSSRGSEHHIVSLVPIFPRIQSWQEVDAATLDLCNYLRQLALGSSVDQADPSAMPCTLAGSAVPTKTVRVVLIAHSMGGLVVADALRILLDPTHANHMPGIDDAIAPLSVITLDTPYFGLSNDVLAIYAKPVAHGLLFAGSLAACTSVLPPFWMKIGLASVAAVGGLVAAAPHVKAYREFLKPLFLTSMESRLRRIQFMLDCNVPFQSYYSTAQNPNTDQICTFISVPGTLPQDVASSFKAVNTTLTSPIDAHAHMVDQSAGESVYAAFLVGVADEISGWLAHARSAV